MLNFTLFLYDLFMKKEIYPFIISILVTFLLIFFYSILLYIPTRCNHIDNYVTIPKNATVNTTAKILDDNLCLNKILFKIAMKATFNEKNIKYGRYDFKSINNMRDLISMITSVSSDRIQVTIVEGRKMQDIALHFEQKMTMDVEKFLELCFDQSLINSLGLSGINSLEGYLYPDTYKFLKTYTESDVIKIMVNQFKYNYDQYVNNKTALSMKEVVVLGSIIQGEAMYSDEMNKISSVYHNRLKKNMLLQADPTIQYILPKKKKKILVKDTKIQNPYNTYINKGLPPGPINNPGIDALLAAANPLTTDFLYFVADKKGRHIFNKTFKAHLRSKK